MQLTEIDGITIFNGHPDEESDFFSMCKYDLYIHGGHSYPYSEMVSQCSKNRLVFEGNKFWFMGCEKFIILEKGKQLTYIWTSFKGEPEKIKWHENELERVYDMLILYYSKKGDRIACIGNSYEGAISCWKNQREGDIFACTNSQYLKAIEDFKQATIQGQLLF